MNGIDNIAQNTGSSSTLSIDATVCSGLMNGEARLTLEQDGLTVDSLFDRAAIAYADIESVSMRDYCVYIACESGEMVVSRLGANCEVLFRKLLEAIDAKVTKVFGVTGEKLFETKGQYSLDGRQGEATVRLYNDCLCIFTPNRDTRRFPLALLTGMQKQDWALTLTAATGESCTLSRLGRDLEPLERRIAAGIRALRDGDTEFIKNLTGSQDIAGSAQLSRVIRDGIAFPLSRLEPHAKAHEAVMAKIQSSKLSDTWPTLVKLCDPSRVYVGIASVPEEEAERLSGGLLEKLNLNVENPVELTKEQEEAQRYNIWAFAPGKGSNAAVVEFAFPGEDTATYVFRVEQPYEIFAARLNAALNATALAREVLMLPAARLSEAQYADGRMLVDRTPSLQSIRAAYAGRVIHRSAASWQAGVEKLLEQLSAPAEAVAKPRFCTGCGEPVSEGARFCAGCGARL